MGLLDLSELAGLGQGTITRAPAPPTLPVAPGPSFAPPGLAPPPLPGPAGPGGYARQYIMPGSRPPPIRGEAPEPSRPVAIVPGVTAVRPATRTRPRSVRPSPAPVPASRPPRRGPTTTVRYRNQAAAAQAAAARAHRERARRAAARQSAEAARKASFWSKVDAYKARMKIQDDRERRQRLKEERAILGYYGEKAMKHMEKIWEHRNWVLENVPEWAWKEKLPAYVIHKQPSSVALRKEREKLMSWGPDSWPTQSYGESLFRPDMPLKRDRRYGAGTGGSERARRALASPSPYSVHVPTRIQPFILDFLH